MKKAIVQYLCIGLFPLLSCTKDKAPAPSDCGMIVSYTEDIRPIIETSCKTHTGPGTGCHDAWIDDYNQIVATVNNGTLYNEIFVEHTMPEIPNDWGIDSLTAGELEVIECWLDQGYLEN